MNVKFICPVCKTETVILNVTNLDFLVENYVCGCGYKPKKSDFRIILLDFRELDLVRQWVSDTEKSQAQHSKSGYQTKSSWEYKKRYSTFKRASEIEKEV